MSDPISQLGLSCPSGGDFYICQGNSTQFLGCCTSDPCSDGKGTCPQSDLRASSFNESSYNEVKSQACGSSSGKWYTCSELDTPFLGCCSSNACADSDGCPTKALVAARLSDNSKSAAVFETTAAASTATTATASSSSSSSGGGSSSSISSVMASSTPASASTSATGTSSAAGTHGAGLPTGAKAGIGVGAAVMAAALVAALFLFWRRYLKNSRGVVVTGSPPSVPMSHPTNSYLYHDPNRILHTPPPLSSPSLEPLAASHPGRSPRQSQSYAHPPEAPATSSPSSWEGALSRHGSSLYPAVGGQAHHAVRSSSSASLEQERSNRQQSGAAELETAETPGSLSELPCSPPWSARLQSHPPSMYRPYRPSMQEFGDVKSGLYP